METSRRTERKLLGVKIRDARKQAGLHQSDLANVLGVSQSMVSQYERGVAEIDTPALRKIVEATGVDPEWLLGRANGQAFIEEMVGKSMPNLTWSRAALDATKAIDESRRIELKEAGLKACATMGIFLQAVGEDNAWAIAGLAVMEHDENHLVEELNKRVAHFLNADDFYFVRSLYLSLPDIAQASIIAMLDARREARMHGLNRSSWMHSGAPAHENMPEVFEE